MTIVEMLKSLGSEECPHCHREKRPKETFCGACYRALPKRMRNALYRLVGLGYEEAVRDALAHLAAIDEREQGKLFGGGS